MKVVLVFREFPAGFSSAYRGDPGKRGKRVAGVRGAPPLVQADGFALKSVPARCGLAGRRSVVAGSCPAVLPWQQERRRG